MEKKQPNKKVRDLLKKYNLIRSENYLDIIKERLMDITQDNKFKKLITVNEYKDQNITYKNEKKLLNRLINMPKSEMIIVQDFGHNLFSDKIILYIGKFHNKLSVNVQTNSLNYGYNILD